MRTRPPHNGMHARTCPRPAMNRTPITQTQFTSILQVNCTTKTKLQNTIHYPCRSYRPQPQDQQRTIHLVGYQSPAPSHSSHGWTPDMCTIGVQSAWTHDRHNEAVDVRRDGTVTSRSAGLSRADLRPSTRYTRVGIMKVCIGSRVNLLVVYCITSGQMAFMVNAGECCYITDEMR